MCSHTVTFWYGTAFSDSPRYFHSEGSFPGRKSIRYRCVLSVCVCSKNRASFGQSHALRYVVTKQTESNDKASATNRPNLSLANKILVLLELSVKANDGLVADGPQLLAHATDEELVVGDHNHAALELVQRVRQRLDRLCALYSLSALTNIEMVGGLIQHQNVRPRVRDHGEGHARLLASTQRLHRPLRHVCASIHRIASTLRYAEASELAAQLRNLLRGVVVLHDLQRRLCEIELIEMMLGEHRAAQLVVADHLALQRNQVAQQQLLLKKGKRGNLDQCGFTNTVGTENTNTGLEVDSEVDVAEENAVGSVPEKSHRAGNRTRR